MYIRRFDNYMAAEKALLIELLHMPQFITKNTNEVFMTGFVLKDPLNNRNDHSDYMYAEEFFQWMMTGEIELSDKLTEINPWVKRFTDRTGLPETFSSSYGWKIKAQRHIMQTELYMNKESRRAYINILQMSDQIILSTKTTHEFPCTIGLHLLIRDEELHLIVNMRSNNVYSVMPYDVYLFTRFQQVMAERLEVPMGMYHHQINSAHLYKGDVRRLKQTHNI